MTGKYAILYGQVADYNQLVVSHRDTFDEIKSRYKSVTVSLSEIYNGNLINQFDDTIKVVFKLSENAVRFASELFRKLSLEPRIPYRIVLHYGEIDCDNEDIYGKEAGIISNLLQICPEGTVLLSGNMRNMLATHAELKIKHVGNTLLKGMNDQVDLFCLSETGMYVPEQIELLEKSKNKNSIAILPFHNTSSEKELDYICEGIAEEIIDRLSKVKDIFVTARASSFMFRKREASILEISRRLNVSYLLDGSIRKRNNEYRISYQLVDCITGYNLVSDTLTFDFDRLYDSEIEISKHIIQFFNKDNESIANKTDYYIDPTAYSYYLKGKYLAYQPTKESKQQALQFFKKALDIVPDYALAYAGLSVCYLHIAINKFDDYITSMHLALENADKAIEADSGIPDGFISKAIASFWMGNWFVPDFEKNLTQALTLSPCNAEIRMFNSMLFLFKGELKRALSEILLAKKLDPLDTGVSIRMGLIQYLNREYEDAHNTYQSILHIENFKTYNALRLAWCCIMLKQYDKGLEYLKVAKPDYEFYDMSYSCNLVIYHALKDDKSFYKYKSAIEALPETNVTYHYNHAILNKLLGKYEDAVFYLQKTLQNPITLFLFVQYDEFWKELWWLPSFENLIETYYSGNNKLVKITSVTKEYLEINMSDFLYAEAQDNYTRIAYKENKNKKETILRATLSSVESQLPAEEIFRCHRSYLVKMDADFIYHRFHNKTYLFHPYFNIKLPVSRVNEKQVKELF